MTGHHELRCRVHPFGTLSPLRFVVVCSFCRGQMLLSYHSGHRSWETQGGHIEEGETPEDAARRELYEESGVADADILPVCDYYAYDSEGASNGRVYAAVVRRMDPLPPNEMSAVRAFDALPDSLTYPFVTPVLFREAAKAVGWMEAAGTESLQARAGKERIPLCDGGLRGGGRSSEQKNAGVQNNSGT